MKTLVCLTALAALLAGCQASPESKPADPQQPAAAKPAAPSTPAAPAAPSAPAAPLAPADAKPIAVELSKFAAIGEFKDSDHFGYDDGNERMFYYANGCAEAAVKIPAGGEYEITVKAACDEAEKEFARFRLRIDGQAASGEVVLAGVDPKDYKVVTKIAAGDRKLGIEFTNDIWKEGEYDRNLFIHGVSLKRVK
jgi:pyruvate/2-oxoglutarate dehydrogenase complex dihydrolipoamide acyltransferase (E2) component